MSYPGDETYPRPESTTGGVPSQPEAPAAETTSSSSPWSYGSLSAYPPAPGPAESNEANTSSLAGPPPTPEPAPAPTVIPAMYTPPTPEPAQPSAPPMYTYVPGQPYAPAPAPAPTPTYGAMPVPTSYGPGMVPTYAPGTVAVPTPPTYDPTVAAQFSSPPISAYAYGIPSAIAAPPQRPNRTALIVLSIVTVVLVAATGIMSTLFIIQMNNTKKANDATTKVSGQLADEKAAREKAEKDLSTAQNDLSDQKSANDQLTQDKQTLVDCVRAVRTYFQAVNASGGKETPAVDAAGNDLNEKCGKTTGML